ncbi:NUDIX hydrolase [Herbidospora sp. RD11066]
MNPQRESWQELRDRRNLEPGAAEAYEQVRIEHGAEPGRVRAILLTPGGHLLTIKRVRPGQAPYWVFPGGGIEPGDASPEDALLREVREELGGSAVIESIFYLDPRGEYFYLARIDAWDPALRTGPEFADPGRGEYIIEEIPIDRLAEIDLKPEEVAKRLISSGKVHRPAAGS